MSTVSTPARLVKHPRNCLWCATPIKRCTCSPGERDASVILNGMAPARPAAVAMHRLRADLARTRRAEGTP